MAEFRKGFVGTEVALYVAWVSGATGPSATYQEIGTGEGLPLIVAIANEPVQAAMHLVPTGTNMSFDPTKEDELRKYFTGSPYGTRSEIPTGVTGSIGLDLVRNTAADAYDDAINVLERASSEANRLLYVKRMRFIGPKNGKNRYHVQAASFLCKSQGSIDSTSKQQTATYNLQSADSPIVGYQDLD
jgi:hypothetical protein